MDGVGPVSRAQMRVALDHLERGPAAKLPDRPRIHAGHRETRRERVP
jgi:hypothetical protein